MHPWWRRRDGDRCLPALASLLELCEGELCRQCSEAVPAVCGHELLDGGDQHLAVRGRVELGEGVLDCVRNVPENLRPEILGDLVAELSVRIGLEGLPTQARCVCPRLGQDAVVVQDQGGLLLVDELHVKREVAELKYAIDVGQLGLGLGDNAEIEVEAGAECKPRKIAETVW